ncbi:MAG: Uma2 family endonuclease, partial [Kamptonema sp. SIO4C4]|nr:Uma2 family endonuclease [Kamptonema sp. SIO4C4]
SMEIPSPEQSSSRVQRNILHCLAHGTQLGWLIDPSEQVIFVYFRDQAPTIYEFSNTPLPTPDFLPSLQLTAQTLFSWLTL